MVVVHNLASKMKRKLETEKDTKDFLEQLLLPHRLVEPDWIQLLAQRWDLEISNIQTLGVQLTPQLFLRLLLIIKDSEPLQQCWLIQIKTWTAQYRQLYEYMVEQTLLWALDDQFSVSDRLQLTTLFPR